MKIRPKRLGYVAVIAFTLGVFMYPLYMFQSIEREITHMKYLVMVVSNPAIRRPRDLIRRNGYWKYDWKDVNGNLLDWKHYFVVGQSADPAVNEAIYQEADENKDILIGNFEDSYRNLVYKTLWLFEWAVDRFEFDLMIKTDDDVIINMSKFDGLARLQDLGVPFYGGRRKDLVNVTRSGKWLTTMEEYPEDIFPPYCAGGGYTLNKLALNALLKVHRSGVQPVFFTEDAFVGTLASVAKISPVDLSSTFHVSDPQRWCDFVSTIVLVLHNVTLDVHETYIECLHKQGTFCVKASWRGWWPSNVTSDFCSAGEYVPEP